MSSASSPVIIDLGKKKRKAIKKLVNGGGPLLGELESVIADLKAAGTIAEGAQPVVLVVRPKKKKDQTGMGWMGARR